MVDAYREPLRWEKVYVFISSTFNDMHAERDYLVKRVFPELQDWCERRKLRLVDIDLRWGVTEADASSKRAVEVCLERINGCRPFFICFLGQRHGWTPGEEGISEDTFAKFPDLRDSLHPAVSVTELEIRHAIIKPFAYRDPTNRERLIEYQPSQQAFFYFRDPDYLAALPDRPRQLRCIYTDDVGPDDETPNERLIRERSREALRALREEVIPQAARHEPVVYGASWRADYRTPELALPLEISFVESASVSRWHDTWMRFAHIGLDEDQLRVSEENQSKADEYNAALTQGRLSDFHALNAIGDRFPAGADLAEIIQQDLQQAIMARFPDHQEVEHESELQKEIDQQEQFLFAASEGFIKRDGDFAELDEYVHSDSNRLFVLTADGGMGKSTLLANWVDHYRTRIEGLADHSIHFRFIGVSDGSTSIDSLILSLLREIQGQHHKYTGAIPDDPNDELYSKKLREAFAAMFGEVGRRGTTVIIIDALDQLPTGLVDLSWLPETLTENVKLVISFKHGQPLAEKFYEHCRSSLGMTVYEVPPFEGEDDRRQLVDAYLTQYLKQLDRQVLAELIAFPGAHNPLFLKVVLSELRVFGSFSGLHDQIRQAFGDSPVAAFQGVLARMENDAVYTAFDARRIVPLIFGFLAHARTGLSVDEQVELLDNEELSPLDSAEESSTRRDQIRDAVVLNLRQLRPFLARRQGRYDFFYDSFRAAAIQRYQGEPSPARTISLPSQRWHQSLAALFYRQAVREEQGSRGEPTSSADSRRRSVAETLEHIIQGRVWQLGTQVLADESFRRACFGSLGPRFYLRRFEEFVGMSANNQEAAPFIGRLCMHLPMNEFTRPLIRLLGEAISRTPQTAAAFLVTCAQQAEQHSRAVIALRALQWGVNSVEGLDMPQRQKVAEAVTRLLSSDDKRVRWEAVFSYCRLASAMDSAPLLRMLESEDEHPLVRAEAARQLGKLDDPAAVPALLRLIQSPEYPLNVMAAKSARQLQISRRLIDPEPLADWSQPDVMPEDPGPALVAIGVDSSEVDRDRWNDRTPVIIHIIGNNSMCSEQYWKEAEILQKILRLLPCRLVCSEGGSGDCGLDEMKKEAPAAIWEDVALLSLMDFRCHSEEFLFLATDLEFDIFGIDDPSMFVEIYEQKWSGHDARSLVAAQKRGQKMWENCLKHVNEQQSKATVLLTQELPADHIGDCARELARKGELVYLRIRLPRFYRRETFSIDTNYLHSL